ncbi:unnamed protein product [Prorocentrum cordatum]|uniref:Uncharacterized protein n=1 Tax=Prorocentrum cordatum TaxID=2364126 RepID=A0ABN9S7K7_9DINO|nr:unnamed protein product [Polarella glacialis]
MAAALDAAAAPCQLASERRVRGPIGAIQATLPDLGWDPVEATRWHRPTAAGYDEWTLPTAADERFASVTEYQGVLDDVVADLRSQPWRQAACHEEDKMSDSGLNLIVVSGGQWPRELRLWASYALSDGICKRCGRAREDLLHRIWTRADSAGDEAFSKTDALLPRALAGYEVEPSFWLQSVAPARLATPTFDEERVARAEVVIGGPLDHCRDSTTVVTVFGDGSGGRFSVDPRRRRCGAAIAFLARGPDGKWQAAAGRYVPLVGSRQTVPRAEILAFVLALGSTSGAMRFVTAGQAAEAGWQASLFGPEPRTDEFDSIATLVRRPARTAARMAAAESAHLMVRCGSKRTCQRCRRLAQICRLFVLLQHALHRTCCRRGQLLAAAASGGGPAPAPVGTAPCGEELRRELDDLRGYRDAYEKLQAKIAPFSAARGARGRGAAAVLESFLGAQRAGSHGQPEPEV